MKLDKSNTDFLAFFVGLSKLELDELERLVTSFAAHFDQKLIVMDMTHASHKAVAEDGVLWQQDRAFTYDIVPTLPPEDVDVFFEKHADLVVRQQSGRYETRCHRTNRAVYECSDKPFCALLDSDIEFSNDRFFEDASRMTASINAQDFGVLGRFISAYKFGVEQRIYGSRNTQTYNTLMEWCGKLQDWLMERKLQRLKGVARQGNVDELGLRKRGMFPRLDPAFLVINRKRFTELGIMFNMLYLDVDDYTHEPPYDWRILGDEGAGIVYQLAVHKLMAINVDYGLWAKHKGGSWQAMQKKLSNWFYIGREMQGTDRTFWDTHKLPDDMIYRPQ